MRNTCDRRWRSETSRSSPFRTPTSKWTQAASISLSPHPTGPPRSLPTRRAQRRAIRRHNLDPICAHGPEGWMKRQALRSAFHEFQNRFVPFHMLRYDSELRRQKKIYRHIFQIYRFWLPPFLDKKKFMFVRCLYACVYASLASAWAVGQILFMFGTVEFIRHPEDMNRRVPKHKVAIFSQKAITTFVTFQYIVKTMCLNKTA
jgi:hypothetical protein